jgi:hypothetical protein
MADILNEIGRSKKQSSAGNTETGPLSPIGLYELFLFSSTAFVLSALLIQFLITLQNAILLRYFSLKFIYSPLGIRFSFVSEASWSDMRIFAIYGVAPLVFFFTGLILITVLRKSKFNNWKLRLFVTWIAFILIHTFPAGLLAGIFIYDGLGVAFAWLADSLIIRVIIGIAVIVLIRIYRSMWQTLFLKAAYAGVFITDYTNRKVFLTNAFIRPWIMGSLCLIPFVWNAYSLYWGLFLAGLGIVVLPFVSNNIPPINLLVAKSDKKIWPMRYPIVYVLVGLFILWLVTLKHISF